MEALGKKDSDGAVWIVSRPHPLQSGLLRSAPGGKGSPGLDSAVNPVMTVMLFRISSLNQSTATTVVPVAMPESRI